MTTFWNKKPIGYLILIIMAAIVIIGLASCKTIKEVTTTTTIIKDSMVIHTDTTWVTYTNPADSLSLSDNLSAYMDSLGKCRVRNSNGMVQSNKIIIKYVVRNDSIYIDANTKPYEIRIAQLNTTIEKFHSMYQSYLKTTETTKNTTWLSFKWSWICLGLFAAYIVLKVGKMVYKWPIPII